MQASVGMVSDARCPQAGHVIVETSCITPPARTRLTGSCSFKLVADSGAALQSAVAQPVDVIEPVQNHLVVGDDNDRRLLIDGDPAASDLCR